ncbi:Imm50 family immunity protein [Streptomyces sp. NPDC056431]|uniref:Imm50 family immunity protein n=1 Tax=Streptomyces sp. NPDC056431 TaxID=3345814 RepID=UPI00369FF53F
MTLNWADLLVNPEDLQRLYTALPPLSAVTVRSVHLNHYGPTVTLRIDLTEFPQNPPSEWRETGFDRLQCHLQFLAVEHLEMRGWNPPSIAEIQIERCGDHRIRLTAGSPSFTLSFEASDSVAIGHLSAFQESEDGADSGPRWFARKLDSRRFNQLPDLNEKTFYEHM